MRNYCKWLLALSLAALLAPAPLLAAKGGAFSGSVEVGAAGVDIRDDKSRVNEYTVIRPDDGAEAYGKVDLSGNADGLAVDAEAEYMGSRDQAYDLNLDVKRVLKLDSYYGTFGHWLDHDKLDYLNAGVPTPQLYTGGLDPNNVPGFWNTVTDTAAGAFVAGETQQIGRAGLYGEDFVPDKDFFMVHREWQNQVDLTVPQLPNLTFHVGYRLEEREGTEQSIGMSKCTTCHITGQSKDVDEETQDFTAGVTGRFGLFTVEYAYLDRQFRENASDPSRRYDPALSPNQATTYSPTNGTFDNRLIYDYEDGVLPYEVTPESDKESHVVKAKVDLPKNTAVLASLVNTEVESKKFDEPGIFTLADKTLTTTYDAYGLKAASRLSKNLRLSLHAKLEELDNDEALITFFPMAQTSTSIGSAPGNPTFNRESVIDRDVVTAGIDAVYRIARKTRVRLGYEYEEIDRDDAHFGTTETHTAKASLKARPAKDVSTRLSYSYQNVDNPFQHENAAGYIDPATGLPYTNGANFPGGFAIGNGPQYGTDYYDLRQADLSNLPEDVHEGKLAATWSPAANFAATLTYRVRFEENELDQSSWEQETHSPGVSLWYAPSEKLNLTFAYNYLGQSTESKFCQGWYDG